MKTSTNFQFTETINKPYESVSEALVGNTNRIFHEATHRAELEANDRVAQLHAKIGGIEFRRNIRIQVVSYIDFHCDHEQQLRIGLNWESATAPNWFPKLEGRLILSPMDRNSTRLDFEGEYDPPLGLVGQAINSLAGNQIADSSVHQFVKEIAEYLNKKIE